MPDWRELKQTPLGAALALAGQFALAAGVFVMLLITASCSALGWFLFPTGWIGANVFFTLCALVCLGAQVGTLYWIWLGIGDLRAAVGRRG